MSRSTAQQFTDAAIRFAQAGAEVVMRHFLTDLPIETKDIANLVSQADLESEQTIIKMIEQDFPDHAWLAEETGSAVPRSSSPHLWVVDPLDGTNNFAHGIPHFAVSVALYCDRNPVCGAVLNPARDDLYVATTGDGATWNGQPIRVSKEPTLQESIVGTGFYYDRGDMMRRTLKSIETLFETGIHGIRRFGTASLDLCHVASGKYGAFFEYELAPWDFAAGRLIVEEAGGTVSDCQGTVLPMKSSSVLASNGLLHSAMLECVGHQPN